VHSLAEEGVDFVGGADADGGIEFVADLRVVVSVFIDL